MLDVSTAPPHKGTVLIFTIRATGAWWRHVGENLGFEKFYTVSDIRNDKYCDYNIVADFYRFYRKFYESSVDHAHLLTAEEVTEVRARCRVLRWLPQRKATAMALAMAASYDRVLEATQPNIVVSFPIDRYTSDVLERLAKKRGIPFFELTASAFDNMGMLLYRGQLIRRNASPDIEKVEQLRAGFTEANFTPSYVQKPTAYTRLKWLSVFGYFRLRGWVFKAISVWKRDTLNLHYLDSQSFLEHKPSLSDIGIIDIFDRNWRDMIDRFPKGRRIFIPLQLFPEASIDYWINELDLLFHEDLIF